MFRIPKSGRWLPAGIVVMTLAWGTAVVTPAAAFAQAGAAQQPVRSDADIQTDVVRTIASLPPLQGQHVQATVSQGEVTLTGTVETREQSDQAEMAADGVGGVLSVVNQLQVLQPSSGPAQGGGYAAESAGSQQQPPPPPAEPAAGTAGTQPAAQPVQAGQLPPPPPPDGPAQPAQGQTSTSQQPYSGARPPYQPAPQSNGYQNYGAQPNYGAAQQPIGPVTVSAGTMLQVRSVEPLDTSKIKDGTYFEATVASDVYAGNALAIPRGATIQGQVIESKDAGVFGGHAILTLRLTSLNLAGQFYPIASDIWSSQTPSKAGYTATNTAGGALVGTMLGAIFGGGAGAAVGALAGGVGGMAASAPGSRNLVLPPETLLTFHLAQAVTVNPVSWQTAQRLAANAPQAPQLQRRRVYAMPPPPPYYYPYGYPYYYVRPY